MAVFAGIGDWTFSKETDEMGIVLDTTTDLGLTENERLARLRVSIDRWLDSHERMVRALGETRTVHCWLAGRRIAGHECFDCDFEATSGRNHSLTVSVCNANGLADGDAEVVDAVSALTLIGMLLDRLKIRPMLVAR